MNTNSMHNIKKYVKKLLHLKIHSKIEDANPENNTRELYCKHILRNVPVN